MTTKRVQSIGYQQQFIDEATSVSKMCIYTLLFSGKTVMAHYELSASTCVEDAS